MPVGEIILSAFLQALFQELGSALLRAFPSWERVENHLKKWSQTLKIIQAVLDDAEVKQSNENAVRVWLEELTDLSYDLDDILDEITTKALSQQSEGAQPGKCLLWKMILSCNGFLSSATASNRNLMSRIKKITSRFDEIEKQKNTLNLRENLGGDYMNRSPSTSLSESHILGRDEDKKAVCNFLLDDKATQNAVSVILIVGMGGIGKTTLAQLVYNDRTVKYNFHVRAWVCVSHVFNELAITKTIYMAVTNDSGDSKNLNMLQVDLQQKLSKIKFLIVLDDVWDVAYEDWVKLCLPLQSGLHGSRIIVTTRLGRVTSLVGSVLVHPMKVLTEADCFSLLEHHCGRSIGTDPDFKRIGKRLVRKCKGLPLAAKALGGVLRTKVRKEEWEDVLNSNIWNLPEKNNILNALRLSYHHLPPHLKHLFAYCSIFPKDYEFDQNELVLLWMGEGFLQQPSGSKGMEELGHEYFNDLLSRSFFQCLSDTDSHFVMHDLINDLAQFVA